MNVRLAGFLPSELSDEQLQLYHVIADGPRAAGPQVFPLVDEAGRLRGPFNAMLLSPPLGMALQSGGRADCQTRKYRRCAMGSSRSWSMRRSERRCGLPAH